MLKRKNASGTWDEIKTGGCGYQETFDMVRPINSIYIQYTADDNPNTLFNVGGKYASTWTDITSNYSGRYFKADVDSSAGTEQTEQLPNIKGQIGGSRLGQNYSGMIKSGAFSASTTKDNYAAGYTEGLASLLIDFNAHNFSTVYTDNGAVRPLTATIKVWKRTS